MLVGVNGGLLILFLIGVLGAWLLGRLLHRAGAPGAMILAGVLIGLVIGPTMFGRMMPDTFESWVVGGQPERLELRRQIGEHEATMIAAEAAGLDDEAVESLRLAHRAVERPLEAQWDQARWDHQQPLRLLTILLAGLIFLSAGRAEGPCSAASPRQFQTAVSIGIWLAMLPPGAALLLGHFWWQWTPETLWAVAAALAIGIWRLPASDLQATEAAERGGAATLLMGGRLAGLFATIALGWSILQAELGTLWVAALTGIPAGVLLSSILPAQRYRRPARIAVWGRDLLVAGIALICLLQIDMIEDFALWPCLLLAILSVDGRWSSALIGTLALGGRGALRSMRLLLPVVAIGPTQLAVVALGLSLGLLPPEAGLALVCGAILAEVSGPLRTRMARETEALESVQP